MVAWFMKFWQMVMELSSKFLVLVRIHEYRAAGCLVRQYTVSIFWICYVLSMMRVGV